jgi:hypothetical protein
MVVVVFDRFWNGFTPLLFRPWILFLPPLFDCSI